MVTEYFKKLVRDAEEGLGRQIVEKAKKRSWRTKMHGPEVIEIAELKRIVKDLLKPGEKS